MKIGRNDQCSCGSSKKYKKCCLNKKTKEIPPEVVKYFQRKNTEHQILRKAGIHIPLVPPIVFKGKGTRAFGNKVYTDRPIDETFHIFLISMLRAAIGKDWWSEQQVKQVSEKHFIARCFEKFEDWLQRNKNKAVKLGKTNIWSAIPDGYSKSLLLLAFDVICLTHTSSVPDSLLARLKSKNEYQGARYEIAVAAVFTRLQCDIKFTEVKSSNKRCEFVATHCPTGFTFAVEVKSRHREGVLNEEGTKASNEELLSLGTASRRLFREALKQNPRDMPFLVFIDVNSPITPDITIDNKPWVKEMKNMVSVELKDRREPYPLNAVFFTNFSYHYQTENEAQHGEMAGIYIPTPLNPEFFGLLEDALNNYGFVPPVELEESSLATGVPTIYE